MPVDAHEVTVGGLRTFLGGKANSEEDAYLQQCIDNGAQLVADLVKTTKVPGGMLSQAVLETAADHFDRRTTRGGVLDVQSMGYEASVVRVSTDPLYAAKRLLALYLGPAIA